MALQSDASPFALPIRNQNKTQNKKVSNHLLTPKSYEIRNEEVITIDPPDGNVEQFLERKELLISSLEYARDGNNPGLVLIFNQEEFQDNSYRYGSRRDVNEIIMCMSRLGFNINENHIYKDLTRLEIINVIKDITKTDLSQVNCLIVFFLTHGDSFNLLHAYDGIISADELWNEFTECEYLKNKPKMFIFQACKGDGHSTISSDTGAVNEEQVHLVPTRTFKSNYIGPDTLIVYSTTEGSVSFRDAVRGTWFIQELCKNFSAYGRRDDVLSLIMRTTKCVCRNYYYYEGDVIKKQMPVFVSTLKKKFYLTRSKDRNILFKLLENQEKIQKNVEELEVKVKEMMQEKDKKNK